MIINLGVAAILHSVDCGPNPNLLRTSGDGDGSTWSLNYVAKSHI